MRNPVETRRSAARRRASEAVPAGLRRQVAREHAREQAMASARRGVNQHPQLLQGRWPRASARGAPVRDRYEAAAWAALRQASPQYLDLVPAGV